MHLPTATFRASRTIAVATIVARDYVRVIDERQIFSIIGIVNLNEALPLLEAIVDVPDHEKIGHYYQLRDDWDLVRDLGIYAKEEETLRALADSMYQKTICRELERAGEYERAKLIRSIRAESTTTFESVDPDAWRVQNRFGIPIRG